MENLIDLVFETKEGRKEKIKVSAIWVCWELENDDRLEGDGDSGFFCLYQKDQINEPKKDEVRDKPV